MKLFSCLLKIRTAMILVVISLTMAVIASAQSDGLPKTVHATRVRQLSRVATKRIGSCDQVLASAETDSLFILRGAKLSQLSLIEPYVEKLVGENESFVGQTLEATFTQNGRIYVLFSSIQLSKTKHPFLYEIGGKKILPLAPYGLGHLSNGKDPLPGYVNKETLYVNGNGMLYQLMLAAPAGSVWSWIELTTGRIDCHQGWHLDYTDMAGRIAVFSYYKDEVSIPAFGIDIATGETAYNLPTKLNSPKTEKSNLDTREVLIDRDEYTYETLSGVAAGTKGYYRGLFPADSHDVERVDASDTFAALHVRYSDIKKNESDADESLWVMPLKNGVHAKRVCYDVQDFAMLDGGYCVYSRRTSEEHWLQDTAYLYNFVRHESSALLDGVEPEVPPDVKPFFVDMEWEVKITPGFGRATNGRLAFAEVRQFCYDKRDLKPLMGVLPKQTKLWKFFLISSQGNRYEIEFPIDPGPDNNVFLHNQGAVVLQIPHESGGGYDLDLFQFKLPRVNDK